MTTTTSPPRAAHRFALTKRQIRNQVAALRAALTHARDEAAREQEQATRERQAALAETTALRTRLAAADKLITHQQQQLRAARVDLGSTRQQLAAAEAMGRRIGDDLRATQAAFSNRHRVDVPPMHRDTEDSADQATVPVDVKTLQEALGGGR